jgi:hypothetical protein
MISDVFDVPRTPTLTRAEVIERVEAAVRKAGIAFERIDVSDVPVRRNALSDAAGRRVQFPPEAIYDRCFVALVDLDTSARWAHRAFWAFVPADDDTGPVALRETSLPEHPRGSVRLYAAK